MTLKSILNKIVLILPLGFYSSLSLGVVSSTAVEKQVFMDCQTTNKLIKRVILKAQKKQDQLSRFEVVLVDSKGLSTSFNSADSLDVKDPEAIGAKTILIIARPKEAKKIFESATTVSLLQNEALEDMSCLSVQHKAGLKIAEEDAILKNQHLINEMKFHKFSGSLRHKNELVQLTCYSPMVPREGYCDVKTDAKNIDDGYGSLD